MMSMQLHIHVEDKQEEPKKSSLSTTVNSVNSDSDKDEVRVDTGYDLERHVKSIARLAEFLGLVGMAARHKGWRRNWLRFTLHGCTLNCFANLFLMTRVYRDVFFDTVLSIMHVLVGVTFEFWLIFLSRPEWSEVAEHPCNTTNLAAGSRILVLQTRLGKFFAALATILIYIGWVVPLVMSIVDPSPDENGGWYFFLCSHGLFLIASVPPWAIACVGCMVLFSFVSVHHYNYLEAMHDDLIQIMKASVGCPPSRRPSATRAESPRSLLVMQQDSLKRPLDFAKDTVDARTKFDDWLNMIMSPILALWLITCILLNTSGEYNLVARWTGSLVDESSVNAVTPARIHPSDIVYHYVQELFFLIFGLVVGTMIITTAIVISRKWNSIVFRLENTMIENNGKTAEKLGKEIVAYIKSKTPGYSICCLHITTARGILYLVCIQIFIHLICFLA